MDDALLIYNIQQLLNKHRGGEIAEIEVFVMVDELLTMYFESNE
jgi:hypothetical protein